MADWIRLVGPNGAVELFGVRLVGVNAENGKKLVFTIVFVGAMMLTSSVIRRLSNRTARVSSERVHFWFRQGIQVFTAVLVVVGVMSIWFDDPKTLATAMGLVTAGLAFALQRVITAVAGYVVILRGRTFNIGDRIVMGGVRGDVIALTFTQTTIMEMGQPPAEQADSPAMWVRGRQYTGRIVTVTNAKIFDEPVYNYSKDFPYVWEEMTVGIAYGVDRRKPEQILMDVARRNTTKLTELSSAALEEMKRRYFLSNHEQLEPRVYVRLTDNWVEMALRFIAEDHGVRGLKDRMSREIIDGFDAAGIEIASTSLAISGTPTVRLERLPAHARNRVRA